MKLHYRTLGEGKPLLIMHGVFGSSDNWQTVGKEFAKHHQAILIDLRNHGKSPHSNEFNYEVMAEDVVELMEDLGIESANILGHSMGGKVAMTLATKYPERVEKLIVVDIAPKHYPPHHQQIFAGFKSVRLDSITSRKEADDQMASVISNMGVRQFILKNLDRDANGHFRWKLNLAVIEEKANTVGAALDGEVGFTGKTLFIGGTKSDYILLSDHQMIHDLFPDSTIEMIEGAGHWVHAERPVELKDKVLDFLK